MSSTQGDLPHKAVGGATGEQETEKAAEQGNSVGRFLRQRASDTQRSTKKTYGQDKAIVTYLPRQKNSPELEYYWEDTIQFACGARLN